MKRNNHQDDQQNNDLFSRVKKRNIFETEITEGDKNKSENFASTTSEQHFSDSSNNSPINDADLFSKFFESLEISDEDPQHKESSEPNRPSISLSSEFSQTQDDSHNSSFKFSTISERGPLPLSSENQDLKLFKPDTFRDTSLPRFSTPQQISNPDISTTPLPRFSTPQQISNPDISSTPLPGFSTSQPPQNQTQQQTTQRPFFSNKSAFLATK